MPRRRLEGRSRGRLSSIAASATGAMAHRTAATCRSLAPWADVGVVLSLEPAQHPHRLYLTDVDYR